MLDLNESLFSAKARTERRDDVSSTSDSTRRFESGT